MFNLVRHFNYETDNGYIKWVRERVDIPDELTHEQKEKAFGKYDGKELPPGAMIHDEPCLESWDEDLIEEGMLPKTDVVPFPGREYFYREDTLSWSEFKKLYR